MELLLFLGGVYIASKVGLWALGAAIDVVVGGVKLFAAAAVIIAIYTYAQSAGLL